MLVEPDELSSSAADEKGWIESLIDSPHSTVLLAEDFDKLIGFAAAYGQSIRRRAHSTLVVIGVMQQFRGKGIGRSLMVELERWAMARGLKRLELQVVTQNDVAIGLYKSLGYSLEGTKRMSMIAKGKALDEHVMAKLLVPSKEN